MNNNQFVYFDNDKQSFKFLKGDGCLHIKEGSAYIKEYILPKFIHLTSYFDQVIKKNNNYTLYNNQDFTGVYKITGFLQFAINDIVESNSDEWRITIKCGSYRYSYKVNNKLSPDIIIPICIYGEDAINITLNSNVDIKFSENTTFFNVLVEKV